MDQREFSEPLASVIQDLLPLLRQLFSGRYAIAVAGSHGKKKDDGLSDIDLRAYYEAWIDDTEKRRHLEQEINGKLRKWSEQGVEIDGYWPRRIADIDARLNAVLSGENTGPDPCIWTIWGYYLPTDIANNTIIEDPRSILAGWKEQLRTYPEPLKKAVIKKHLDSALYWRSDYHYENKVRRQDVLFCMGLASLLVHDLVQVLFALNRAYYSGDGWNLAYLANFTLAPPGFADACADILLVKDPSGLRHQRDRLCRLIDQVEDLVRQQE